MKIYILTIFDDSCSVETSSVYYTEEDAIKMLYKKVEEYTGTKADPGEMKRLNDNSKIYNPELSFPHYFNITTVNYGC